MATTIRALKMGDPGAYAALLSATAAYGFVHALGPGHGKYLVGGVGLASAISPTRLVGLAFVSSIAQSLWAIVLVYGGFLLLETGAHQMTGWAENILAPMSYIAISCVGLALIFRGVKALPKTTHAHAGHHHSSPHSDACGCGHAHGPTPEQAANITSLKEGTLLVLSIAIRPCTGAIFLLVIAWQMDFKFAGALAVVVMGLGTAALTGIVALSSTSLRRLTLRASGSVTTIASAFPALQIIGGTLIVLFSLGLLGIRL
ncbi:hypothetical protein [Shimia sp. R10_1]|uniref:nickel/cobalt transporter n=1 Tax=Shimia sp. R10_1 TaxID=2821095 RepID=UPI001ADC46A0|nr:hypothetical protein [Shimia sp. R10_1]